MTEAIIIPEAEEITDAGNDDCRYCLISIGLFTLILLTMLFLIIPIKLLLEHVI